MELCLIQLLVNTSYQAWLAQSVEHETLNLRVVGSSPTLGDPFQFLELWHLKSFALNRLQSSGCSPFPTTYFKINCPFQLSIINLS
jgi:hypothetical protein